MLLPWATTYRLMLVFMKLDTCELGTNCSELALILYLRFG